jgi:hypothetical protein
MGDSDMTKEEAIQELHELDHCFVSEDACKAIAGAFGLTVTCQVWVNTRSKSNPKGLLLHGGATKVVGLPAEALAERIAGQLDPEFRSWQTGRGFRLRTAIEAICKVENLP